MLNWFVVLGVHSLSLTAEEQAVFQDLDYFRHRDAIEVKLERYFSELQQALQTVVRRHSSQLPAFVLASPGKYSRGERHLGAPYRVLDLPNVLTHDTYFAYRCCLLWGRQWGAHVVLMGAAVQTLREKLHAALQAGEFTEGYLCQAQTPWGWRVEEDEAVSLSETPPGALATLARAHPFLKLSRYWPLDAADAFATEAPPWFDALLEAATR